MSERRLKLGHRKEYKRKSKHTRNPSYYPRHLTKVTLADFDADFNLRVSKEVAAQRGYGRKVLDKSCHIAWDHGYGYVKESRIVKFIAKYVGKPYKELAKAWNEWIKPIKNTDKTEYLDDYFTDYRWRQAFFRVDDNGLVQSVEQTPKGRRYNISTKQWKENRNHALPKFGKIAKPHKAADYYDYCYGFANSNPRYAEIQSSLDALTKSVEDIEAGITVTFSDGVTPVTMEYLTNEINNAHYRLSITSRCITVNHGYGQLYPLVKRIDYERTIQEMARETSM